MDQQIPKIIHYCWFGGNPLPDLAVKCMESWIKHCPEYEIRRWDESNFDVNCCEYVRQAYAAKKWAFVSDVARLYALVNFGGIYLDTDVQLLRPLEEAMLEQSAFCGLESPDRIATAVIACEKGNRLFSEMLDGYFSESFLRSDGTMNMSTNVKRLTGICKKLGFSEMNKTQILDGLTVYPIEYFCPKDLITGKIQITAETYAIHHYDASWWSEEQKWAGRLLPALRKVFSEKTAKRFAKALAILCVKGVRGLLAEISRRK